MRIALVSTPRSGNVWFHHCLRELTGIPVLAVHRISDIADMPLPMELAIQIHAPVDDQRFNDWIRRHDFQVVSVHRHPLDTLISMLRFAHIDASALQWLDRYEWIEPLRSLGPADAAWFEWCKSSAASAYLGISHRWISERGSVPISYERLVSDPYATLTDFLTRVGSQAPSREAVERVTSRFSTTYFKTNGHHHSWRGQVGNWTRFFTQQDSEEVYLSHQTVFDSLGYTVEEATLESREQTLAAWDLEGTAATATEWLVQAARELDKGARRLELDLLLQKEEAASEVEVINQRMRAQEDDLRRELEAARTSLADAQAEYLGLQRSYTELEDTWSVRIGSRISRLLKIMKPL